MLVVVGLNAKSATVAHRERLAIPADALVDAAKDLAAAAGVEELVLLGTCYRVEAYAAAEQPEQAVAALRSAFAARAGGGDLPLFSATGEEALRHLLRVASSLESAVLGEPQILGQVREAHARAVDSGLSGRELNGLFHKVFQLAKRVRTGTDIGRCGVSWGNAASTLAEKVLGSLAGRRVLVLGAGEMARLSAQHLRHDGADVVVVNRTLANAEALAAEVGGVARPIEALESELLLADVVVSAAPAAPAAFAPAAIAAAMRSRRDRDLVLVDLAVPRAIQPEAGQVEGVYLCDVDDLARLTAKARDERAAAVAQAEGIIEDAIQRYVREQAERRAAPVIQAIRRQASDIAREEVDRTLKRLGEDPELKHRLDALASAIVAKLLHAPSTRLREAGGNGGEALITAAVEIFGVEAVRAAQPRT